MWKMQIFCAGLAEPGVNARGDIAGQQLIATKVVLQQNAAVVAVGGRVLAGAVVGRVQVAATTTATVLEKVVGRNLVGGNLGGANK